MTMKIFNSVITVFACLILFSSCSKLLQEKPKSFITQESYYTNEKQAVAGVNGVYSILTGAGGYGLFYRLAEIPTDQGQTGGLFQPSEPTLVSLDNFTFNSSNSVFDNVWSTHYTAINSANLAISKIPNISMDATEQKRLIGEAHFLRALFYFNLVRWFGDVPLVSSYTDNINNLNVPKAKVDSVYKLIIDDLSFAVENLPESYSTENIGRATKGAALTLLGKVYLTIKDWKNAEETLKTVIDLNTYSLFPNYIDLWKPENKNGMEFIFSVQFKAGVVNSQYSVAFAPRSSSIQAGQSFGDIAPTETFMKLYSPVDKRLSIFKDRYTKYNSNEVVNFGHPFSFKYFDLAEGGNSGQNYPILRYADVLLMFAEAQNELQGVGNGDKYSASGALNEVRVRAGLSPIANITYNQNTLRNEIWDER